MACEIDELQTCIRCGYLVSSCNGCPNEEIAELRSTLAARDAEIAVLKSDLQKLSGEFEAYENRTSTGVHSCNDECQRPNCVLRRDNMTLRSALAEAREDFNRIANLQETMDGSSFEDAFLEAERIAAAWLAKCESFVAASGKEGADV